MTSHLVESRIAAELLDGVLYLQLMGASDSEMLSSCPALALPARVLPFA